MKELFIINLLREGALAWASTYVEKESSLLDDFSDVVAAMHFFWRNYFTQLTQQEKWSVNEYTAEFQH